MRLLRGDATGRELARIVGMPELGRLQTLIVTRTGRWTAMDRGMVIGPLGGARLTRLATLYLVGMGTDATDWEALLSRLTAPALEELVVNGCRSGTHVYELLARSDIAAGLASFGDRHSFFIDGPSPAAGAVRAFAERASRLRSVEIDARAGAWDDESVAAFLDAPGTALEELKICARLTEDFVDRLGATSSAKTLRKLNLEFVPLRRASILRLVDATAFPRLERLSIRGDLHPTWNQTECSELVRTLLELPANHPLRAFGVMFDTSLGDELGRLYRERFAHA